MKATALKVKEKGRPSEPVSSGAHPMIHALAEAIESNGLTWSSLASKAKLDEHTLWRWRANVSAPSLPSLEAALNAVGYKIVLMSRRGK